MRAISAGWSALVIVSCLTGLQARAQDSSQGPDGEYSYKRPSPTTVTTFRSLYDMCVNNADDRLSHSEHSLCVGYFTGLIDFYLSETPPAQRQFCLPSNPPLTRQQARDKLVIWAGTNPAAFNQPAAVGVYEFLVASFPCATTGGATGAAPTAPSAP
jgi:hypothetical protein